MKNNEHITYGKGLLEGDHIWYIASNNSEDVEALKDITKTVDEILPNAVGLGEVSDEGVTKTPGYGESEAVRNQAGSPVIHSDGDYEPSSAFSLMQTAGDKSVDEVLFGKNNIIEDANGGYVIKENSGNNSKGIFVIETSYDNGGKERTIYPNGLIKLSDDVVYNYSDVNLYPVTITPSVDEFGNAAYTVKSSGIAG
ncbi:hypothetical protein LJB88_02100 [Erysipelotrichaceae bacterium OttesenSCG-928-M19]|nr:hypothetical protein [Erysipelotrichaceae bacterium OttesenSCG-928-M19]